MLADIRLAVRRLRLRPSHSALMILVLGIGIGSTTAIFSVVDQIALRDPPFAHADRLVEVIDYSRASKGGGSSLSPRKIVGWQQQPALFETFEAYTSHQVDISGSD